MKLVLLGLSITSSWGNGHATTYRALARALAARGHRVTFLERDLPWYAANRDLPSPRFARVELYRGLDELRARFAGEVRDADVVMVGSFVPDGALVGDWVLASARGVTAFYDIDTPVTLRRLAEGEHGYLAPSQVPRYRLYLSFTGGPTLERVRDEWGARLVRPLYCACDPELHRPLASPRRWDLGYLGTYAPDRQPLVEELLLAPARQFAAGRFAVAGPQYPDGVAWPRNVERLTHVAPPEHRDFYGAQRFTLNLTRADMKRAGWSPSVRLFEAAACAVPVISDEWPGLERFFEPGREILVARSADDVLRWLGDVRESERRAIGERARVRVRTEHTAAHRALELERWVREAADDDAARAPRPTREEHEATWRRSW